MSNNKTKKHRTIQYVFKISTIIIICGLIVLLLPKIEGFKYSYQKGMPWKYETLIAPLDFPLHKSAEELADYMSSIPETTYFVFAEKEIDKKTKMYKQVKKNGSIVEFPRQNETTLSRWIEGRIRRNGKNITRDAYALFIRKTGDDMENIDKELEKLLCYTLEKDYIDISDVEAITTEQTENKIFDMIDAVALHQQKKALDLYYDLLALKEAPMRILFLLSSQFQRLMIVKSMTNQGFGNKEIALKAGCPEWAVRKYQSQSRAFSMDQLKQAIRDGVEYETAVKTGHMNDQMAVELFLVQYSAGK